MDIYAIYEGLLRGMDDTLDAGETEASKILITDWLDANKDYVRINVRRDDEQICFNSKNELDVYDFQPLYPYFKKNMMDLPVPDYIRFNHVVNMSITYPNLSAADKFSFKDLPHINHCDEFFLNGFIKNTPVWVNLRDLKIDDIDVLCISMGSIRINNWPKGHVDMVHLFTGGYIYSDDIEASIKRYNHDFGIDLFNGLNTDALVLPDIMFTRRMDLIGYRVDVEVTKDDPEYDTLKKLFDMKAFNKLYAYPVKGRTDIFRQIKFKKDRFVISKLNSDIYKKYYQKH